MMLFFYSFLSPQQWAGCRLPLPKARGWWCSPWPLTQKALALQCVKCWGPFATTHYVALCPSIWRRSRALLSQHWGWVAQLKLHDIFHCTEALSPLLILTYWPKHLMEFFVFLHMCSCITTANDKSKRIVDLHHFYKVTPNTELHVEWVFLRALCLWIRRPNREFRSFGHAVLFPTNNIITRSQCSV